MPDTRAKELIRIAGGLFSKNEDWYTFCQVLAEMYHPMRADFTQTLNLGNEFMTDLMDGTTLNVRETLGNSINSMLRQGDWFEITTGDEARDKRAGNALALQRGTKLFHKGVINDPRTNAQPTLIEADHDWVTFGNPVLSWEEAPSRQHLVTRAWHPKLCAWAFSDGVVLDMFFRKCWFSAREIGRKFKYGQWTGALHDDIKHCIEYEPTKEFMVYHAVLLTEEVYGDDPKSMRKTRHKFLSMYLDPAHDEVLNQRGTPIFPYIVPRYRTIGNRSQGFSPVAINGLADSRMLQAMALVLLEQGEKGVDPPIVIDQNIFKNDMNLYSGGVSAVDLGEKQDIREAMQVINTSDGMSMGLQMKQDTRALITEHWLLNKLFLPSVREMREVEVMVRTEEFRRAALPFFSPIESQYHSPWLSTGFEMAVNAGIIPAEIFPPDLQEKDIEWAFTSPLKEAEGQKIVAAFDTAVRLISSGSASEPGLAKQFNVLEATIDAVRGAGAPEEWIKTEGERATVAQEEEQVANIQRTAQLAQQGAGATADVAAAKTAAESAGLL